MIDELIGQVTSQLGLGEGQAQTGVGVIFALLEKFGDNEAVKPLLDAIPGAAALAGAQRGAIEGGGGGLGGLIGGLLGGKAGDLAGAMSALQGANISMDQGKGIAATVMDFAREKAGSDIVEKALASAPALKQFL
jgi:predicted lipid-binding transport protein (Tim44 family)